MAKRLNRQAVYGGFVKNVATVLQKSNIQKFFNPNEERRRESSSSTPLKNWLIKSENSRHL